MGQPFFFNKNCVIGDQDYLYFRLQKAIARAKKIDLLVAFLMESGVRLLENDLCQAVERGAALRILCGNYLQITQPQALYLLKDLLGEKVDLRFYNQPQKAFHPKAYLFENEQGGEIFVGSSNLSRTALTDGLEWNYRITAEKSPQDYHYFKQTFEELFLNHSIIINDQELRRYSKSWKKPKLFEIAGKFQEIQDEYQLEASNLIKYPRPLGAQIEALYELKQTRLEGWDKGLVVAATGTGKTFLAAFDSQNFKRVLFVAHRQEILEQAARTFRCVRPETAFGFFTGERKDINCDLLMATVQTLSQPEYLQIKYFSPQYFDYLIIDEFHHAAADSYQRILDYFRPRFLLGLTATPERMDNQDVFALCDYNLVYEVRLKEAINKGWLVPFRYYGIYDETDYSDLEYRQGRYCTEELEQVLQINRRADLILRHYLQYNSRRALGFCVSRRHAIFMAQYFLEKGIQAAAVISGNQQTVGVLERDQALRKFRQGKLKVLFSVDLFNEGLDIPTVDLVMFLRPTESPTVFLQQLGRGLRRSKGKKYVNVLDFIGNYKQAPLIPYLLTGKSPNLTKQTKGSGFLPEEHEYPQDCFVNFELRLIDLFKKMSSEEKSFREKVLAEYRRIKDFLGERPSRLQMYTYLDADIYQLMCTRKKDNIFRDYLSYLELLGELTMAEKELLDTKAHDFIRLVENTRLTKMYKIPVFLAFYNQGKMKLSINSQEIYESFRQFYQVSSNAIDLLRSKNTRDYQTWGPKEYLRLAWENPLHFLEQTAPEMFFSRNGCFCLSADLESYLNKSAFLQHFKDVLDYRTRRFYKERLEKHLKEWGGSI
ncbi:MAG TPA: DEAD/DEAH box helicase family protein [Clostridia bacterium]|nr:DEAD/DEAH box helicase family protein [Clostridia bacterium]